MDKTVNSITGFKKGNKYLSWLEEGCYERIPKAVWAAIAISRLSGGGDFLDETITELVLEEWACLHKSGIVPQAPYRKPQLTKDQD